MMTITVKLFAQYRDGRFKDEKIAYEQGTTAQMVVEALELEGVSPLGVLLVNGRHVEPSYTLQENDEVALFPKVGGG